MTISRAQASNAATGHQLTPAPVGILQRKCACGGSAGVSGECDECQKGRLSVQRSPSDSRSPADRQGPPAERLESGAPSRSASGHNFGRLRVTSEARSRSVLPRTRLMIQRAAAESSSEVTPQLNIGATAEPTVASEQKPAGLIVEDDAQEVGPGQMRKSEFLDQLEDAICAAADAELAAVGRDTEGCPYIQSRMSYYRTRSSAQVERAAQSYFPQSRVASARDYIPLISERVRRAVAVWVRTGKITGVPGFAGLTPATAPVTVESGSTTTGVQRKGLDQSGGITADPIAIRGEMGTGRALDGNLRSRMEPAFGVDFSNVRVHTDSRAAELSSQLKARAFTIGSDVAFGASQYRPGTLRGDALIAHELAHVVQQGSGGTASTRGSQDASSQEEFEADADSAALGAMATLWGKGHDALSRIRRNARPSMRSGLRLRRCGIFEDEEKVKEAAPTEEAEKTAPTPTPAPAPSPSKRLFEQFQTGEERQQAVDKVVGEMSGKIDTSLMEEGRMFFNGAIPEGEGNTFKPNDKSLRARRKRSNRKPYVEIYQGAFGDGWPLLRTTVWHEYQHVLQMSRQPGMLIPGLGKADAQEVEAYCNEIIAAEEEKLHLEAKILVVRKGKSEEQSGKEYIERTLWRRLNKYLGGVKDQGTRKKLRPLISKARQAAERMVGHPLEGG